jgi:gliding motility-associated-like protein
MKQQIVLFILAILTIGQVGATNHSSSTPAGLYFSDDVAFTLLSDSIYIPNAFSPNEDGRNDRFEIFTKPGTTGTVRSYMIYNRWGTLLFERKGFPIHTDSPDNWWDGYFRGEKATPDTYVYHIEVEYTNGRSIIYTGSIKLVN